MKHLLLPISLIFSAIISSGQGINFLESSAAYGINYGYGNTSDFGMGISFYDFNNDGLDDISFGGLEGEDPQFFRSIGDSAVQVDLIGINLTDNLTKCLLWVDFDNDGDMDLCANNHGSNNALFENTGGLNFTNITATCGMSGPAISSFAGAWGDYDRDGFLDHYSGNRDYTNITDSRNRLYRNNGNGTFNNVSDLAMAVDSQGLGFAVIFTDFDKDGWPDIYIANDKLTTHNTMLKNMGNGTFEDVSDTATIGKHMDGMGIGVADYDNNGFEDYYVTNTPYSGGGFGGNLLCKNNGNGTFEEVGAQLGVRVFYVGWGASFADFDLDGDLDLFVSNFSMAGMGVGDRPNSLFVNQGDGTFLEDTLSAIHQVQDDSFGSAIGDINGDGYPDIAVMNESPENVKLWVNHGGTNNWVKITLEGTVSNRSAVGSWIELYANNMVQYRYTRCGTSYGSQNGRATVFGLGTAASIDSVVIRWPNGLVETYADLEIDQTHHFVEGDLITGVSQLHSTNTFHLEPNPSTGKFKLRNIEKGSSVSIVDAMGRVILSSKQITGNVHNNLQLDLSAADPGIYFVIVNIKSGKKAIEKIEIAR